MAINFPTPATVGEEFVDVSGVTFVWNGYGWTQKAAGAAPPPVDAYTKAESDANFVNVSGDTMSGNLVIAKASPLIQLQKTGLAEAAHIVGLGSNLAQRWNIELGSTDPEGGVADGSSFIIHCYNNDGSYGGQILNFPRTTRLGTVAGDPVAPLGIATKQYVDANAGTGGLDQATADALYVNLTGDTMSGSLLISTPTHSRLTLDTPPGTVNVLGGQVGGKTRWEMYLGNGSAEGGANSGSDFSINSLDDAGTALIGTPLSIQRSSGMVSVSSTLVVSGTLFAHGLLTAVTTPKGHQIGNNGGAQAWGPVTTVDANFLLYGGGENWAGVGADVSGNMWFRVGLAGSPLPALVLNSTDNAVYLSKDPTAPLQAATKQYVDAKPVGLDQVTADGLYVNIAGDTMSGGLSTPVLTISNASYSDINLVNAGVQRNLVRSNPTDGDFQVHQYDAAGTYLGARLQLRNSDGTLTVMGPSSLQGVTCSDIYSGGTWTNLATCNLTQVNCANLNASGTVTASQFTLNNGEYASNRADGQAVFRMNGAAGIVVFDYRGWLNPYYGHACKPGVSALAGPDTFNLHWTGQMGCYVGDAHLGNFAYNSDYRVKKDIVNLSSTWDQVKALRPISYTQAEYTPQIEIDRKQREAVERNTLGIEGRQEDRDALTTPMFAADSIERWGFVAHELQATLLPSAATGVKDDPIAIQSPNPFTLLAAVTKALQEAMARIEALEAQLPNIVTPTRAR